MATLGEFGAHLAKGAPTDPRTPQEIEAEALEAAAAADVVVLCLGEHQLQSGEAGVRTDLTLPHQQVELLRKVHALGKKTVVVLFNGRPLVLEDVLPLADAVVEAWWPGTAGGNAIADVLFGRANPSGRLTMTFPVASAQEPLYYAQFATGRPAGKNHTGRFHLAVRDAFEAGEASYPRPAHLKRTVSDATKMTQTLGVPHVPSCLRPEASTRTSGDRETGAFLEEK